MIINKTLGNMMLLYVDHHDKAYEWAEGRKLQRHPITGAAQLVEIRETVRQIFIRRMWKKKSPSDPRPAIFTESIASLQNSSTQVQSQAWALSLYRPMKIDTRSPRSS